MVLLVIAAWRTEILSSVVGGGAFGLLGLFVICGLNSRTAVLIRRLQMDSDHKVPAGKRYQSYRWIADWTPWVVKEDAAVWVGYIETLETLGYHDKALQQFYRNLTRYKDTVCIGSAISAVTQADDLVKRSATLNTIISTLPDSVAVSVARKMMEEDTKQSS